MVKLMMRILLKRIYTKIKNDEDLLRKFKHLNKSKNAQKLASIMNSLKDDV